MIFENWTGRGRQTACPKQKGEMLLPTPKVLINKVLVRFGCVFYFFYFLSTKSL